MNKFFFMSLVILSSISNLYGRDWKRLSIPDAFCANSQPYSVLYSQKDSDKLAIEMMGGGACWSGRTCRGPLLTSFTFMVPTIPNYSILTESESPFSRHSMLYFPYCNGDIFGGNHIANYRKGKKTYHTGFTNILKAISYLKSLGILNKNIDDLVLYGSSAGSIGSLLHAKNFAQEVAKKSKKTLIVDSPGLHWTSTFWEKFSKKLIKDFKTNFSKIGIVLDTSDGMMADQVRQYCKNHSEWNIGILTSDGDLAMSWIFGGIRSSTFKKLVYSERGLLESVRGIKNCSSWIHPSKTHTFLLLGATSEMEVMGLNAIDFVRYIYWDYPAQSFYQN